MDPLYTGLINLGGTGIFAAVMLWLYVSEKKANTEQRDKDREETSKSRELDRNLQREEMRIERQQCREDNAKLEEQIAGLARLVHELVKQFTEKPPRR